MTNHPTLLGLPAELQIALAEVLDAECLLNLRQTCRELAANTLDVFGRRFFSKRTHLYTEHSLLALSDITGTPKLARNLRRIELVVVTLDSTREERFSDFVERGQLEDAKDVYRKDSFLDEKCMGTIDERGSNLYSICLNLIKMGVWCELKLTANLWAPDEDDEFCLGNWDHHWTDYDSLGVRPGVYGTENMIQSMGSLASKYDIIPGDINCAQFYIAGSLAMSGLFPQHLDMGYQSATHVDSLDTIFQTPRLAPKLSPLWPGLKVLKLGLQNTHDSGAMSCLLRQATGLTHLSLDCALDLRAHEYDFRKHQLISISLTRTQCQYVDLVRFIGSQCKSLQHLHLSKIYMIRAAPPFPVESNWSHFFKLAFKRLGLRSLELGYLHETPEVGEEFSYFLPDGRKHSFVVEGSESWMKDRLADIRWKGGSWYESVSNLGESGDNRTEDENLRLGNGEHAGPDHGDTDEEQNTAHQSVNGQKDHEQGLVGDDAKEDRLCEEDEEEEEGSHDEDSSDESSHGETHHPEFNVESVVGWSDWKAAEGQ